MKQLIIALALGLFTATAVQAQHKTKQIERCHLSADNKYITCCKTTLNPAYKVDGKPVAAKKKAVKPRKHTQHHATTVVHRKPPVKHYQVCTDEGGYYTCCMYESTDGTMKSYW